MYNKVFKHRSPNILGLCVLFAILLFAIGLRIIPVFLLINPYTVMCIKKMFKGIRI